MMRQATAGVLAQAYYERWEHETGNAQLKTYLRGPGKVLRSQSPDMVRQEIYGYLLTHYAISALICQAATAAAVDPGRVKFKRTVRIIRRPGWLARVPWAPSWPNEMLITSLAHVPDLPAADRRVLRCGLSGRAVRCRRSLMPSPSLRESPGSVARSRCPCPVQRKAWQLGAAWSGPGRLAKPAPAPA
jgi:hypothetical protein